MHIFIFVCKVDVKDMFILCTLLLNKLNLLDNSLSVLYLIVIEFGRDVVPINEKFKFDHEKGDK